MIAAPQKLERENDLLVTTVLACFAKFLHLVSESAGSSKRLAGANSVRLIAGTCGKCIGALLELVSRSSSSCMHRLTASEQNDCQP